MIVVVCGLAPPAICCCVRHWFTEAGEKRTFSVSVSGHGGDVLQGRTVAVASLWGTLCSCATALAQCITIWKKKGGNRACQKSRQGTKLARFFL